MMSLTFDWEALTKNLDEASEEYQQALDQGFQKAGLAMIHKFQDEQLSGRTGGDLGLNIRTGNLRDSLKTNVTTQAGQLEGVIYNKGATYWAFHQDGTDRLKKRLFLEEDFEYSGEKMYSSAVEMALDTLR